MESLFKKISSSFAGLFPIVKADDEITDPQVILRHQCQNKECSEFFKELETCNNRVRSKKKTAETCDEEMIDFIQCLDKCVAKTLFSKLK